MQQQAAGAAMPPAALAATSDSVIDALKPKLAPAVADSVSAIEKELLAISDSTAMIPVYTRLYKVWERQKLYPAYVYYRAKVAKLENSEKNLTFAAQLFLNNLRSEHDDAKLDWQTAKAIELFESALEKNPANDDLKIGLGSCYVFGKGRSGDPQETMKGIQELLAVVKKDSTNMKAQFVLAVGGYVSGQYDKSIERFTKVIEAQPDNMEAIAFLADTYAAKGDKENAIKWYNISKRLANNPAYSKEVDERIKMLR